MVWIHLGKVGLGMVWVCLGNFGCGMGSFRKGWVRCGYNRKSWIRVWVWVCLALVRLGVGCKELVCKCKQLQ